MNELAVALEAARAAARLLEERPKRVDHKGVVDLVTEIDRACEAAVREVLARHTPDIEVLGEEEGGSTRATRWVVDPLDGTTNFVHGFPAYAVSVGLEVDGEPVVGVVIDAARGVEYAAAKGRGATADGEPIRVSEVRSLEQALLATGFPYDRRERAAHYLKSVKRALETSQGVRRAGAAALDLALVAAGRLDAYWEFTLSPWDVSAGIVLVREAGGVVTAHDGSPIDRHRPCPLAANPYLHDAMIRMLAEAHA
ncbi:MAG: inositol monophosphatase [Deltaproteobacteria bacterium]|nr:MAG: inositol monophosphatase [Deltaproteobacteria bacterium]